MKAILAVIVLLALFSGANAALCPNVTAVQDFDLTQYLGLWYEISTSPLSKATFERHCYCTRANYTVAPSENGTVIVDNTCNKDSVNGQLDTFIGQAIQPYPDTEPAELEVRFFEGQPYAPYWIIVNDNYENAVVWSCTDIGDHSFPYMWILSRTPSISDEEYMYLTDYARKLTGFDTDKLIMTTQEGCTYPQ